MATQSILLGNEQRLTGLFSYPNDPSSNETLAETILYWFNMTLERDLFKAQGARASIQVENGQYTLTIDGPPEVTKYGELLPKFLNNGEQALGVVEDLKKQTTTWPEGLEIPTENKVWDPQNTGNWRFFLPLGMAMVRLQTLNFFHYPPIRLLDTMRDYLEDPVPVRLIELMRANGVVTEEHARLCSTVMDGAPIAAPDDQGTQYIAKGGGRSESVHLIPIEAFEVYQRAQTGLLLEANPVSDTHTMPVVVYGTPARGVFSKLYLGGDKLGSHNDVRTVEIVKGKQTAVIATGHPYRFYAQSQIDDATGSEVGCGYILPGTSDGAMKTMVDDLITVRWQVQMAKDPTQDPKQVLAECTDYWQKRDQARDRVLWTLVQHQGSLSYPNLPALDFEYDLTMGKD